MRVRLALSAVLLGASSIANAVSLYVATDLGPVVTKDIAESQNLKIKINANGHVMGSSHNGQAGSVIKAFVWDATNGRRNLDTTPNVSDFALDINNDNTIVGWRHDGTTRQSIVWKTLDGVTWTPELINIPGAVKAEARSIDGLGNILNRYEDSNGILYNHLITSSGIPHALNADLQVGNIEAFTIRDEKVYGDHFNLNGEEHGFALDITNGLIDLGSFGNAVNYSIAVESGNSGNTLVGGGYLDSDLTCTVDCVPLNHAMMWDATNGYQDLLPNDPQYSFATDINNPGQIVGHRFFKNLGITIGMALIWEGGVAYDLNALNLSAGWNLVQAHSINDNGRIVGWGEVDGIVHAFLLTPAGTAAAADLAIALLEFPALKPGARTTDVTSNRLKFSVTNNGPDPASKIVASADIPDGLLLDSISISNGNCTISDKLECQIESLNVGEAVTVDVTVSGEGQHSIFVKLQSESVDAGIGTNNNIIAYFDDGKITTTPAFDNDLPPGFIPSTDTGRSNVGFAFSDNALVNTGAFLLLAFSLIAIRRFSGK